MEERFIREKKELAYHAHIFDVYNDYLILPDGQKVIYDLIDHIPGCCVLPVDENGQLIFVRQYRNAVDDMTLEVPAGCMDKGETPEQCIRRELKEETGAVDFNIKPVCVYSVKGKTRVNDNATKESFGMLYAAEIFSFEEIHSEIEKIVLSDDLIRQWTYPLIQPKLISEAIRRGYI